MAQQTINEAIFLQCIIWEGTNKGCGPHRKMWSDMGTHKPVTKFAMGGIKAGPSVSRARLLLVPSAEGEQSA